MILASVGANAMASALELGVFDELGTPVRGADVAGRLGLHEQMLEHLLRLLCSLGLVRSMESQCGDETAALYEAGSIARRYFMKDSPFYCGDSWQFRFSSLSQFGSQISSRVRTGPDVDTFPEGGVSDQCWATLTRTRIVQEQAAITAVAAADIVRNLPEVGRIGELAWWLLRLHRSCRRQPESWWSSLPPRRWSGRRWMNPVCRAGSRSCQVIWSRSILVMAMALSGAVRFCISLGTWSPPSGRCVRRWRQEGCS